MTNYSTTPAYTRYHWAKSDRANPDRIHLLEHHLADVGACFESLLRQPTIGQRLACAGGLEELHPTMAARLCVFAALHDIGKVNMGFQTPHLGGGRHSAGAAPAGQGRAHTGYGSGLERERRH